jgi:poly(3-hydroxybutyrate) depolymerase
MKTWVKDLRLGMHQTAVCMFAMISVLGSQAHAGTWSNEEKLAGMDSVYIYLPTTTPKLNKKRALMINLHGCVMSNEDMKKNADWAASADQFGMVVALPDVPERGAFSLDCWDYYGENHTRETRHNKQLISLANTLMARPELNIDPNQVYITGFSSGGGQANVMACLAPDIFAGVGSSAGPGLGSKATQYGRMPESYSVEKQVNLCRQLAGKYASSLTTQVYSSIQGSADNIVDPQYNDSAANIMASVYNTIKKSSSLPISNEGSELIYSDNKGARVSKITISDMGHSWSTGNGGEGTYFANDKVDYPLYITKWLFKNNRRVGSGKESE